MKDYFAINLKFLRESHKLSQEQLAKKISDKTHQTSVGRWEEQSREPTMGIVVKVAEIFDVPIADIIAKDLRVKGSVKPDDIDFTILKKALTEKGYMKDGEDLTEENFNRLMEIYNANKKFWIK
ncbi:MAG: helix-turn-helix transcriptional regulator [Bacilli bacterium]|jgi:transcriptional regulator with XRE-family HTH domain